MSGKNPRSSGAQFGAGADKKDDLVQQQSLIDLYEADSFRFVPRFQYQTELHISLDIAPRAVRRSL